MLSGHKMCLLACLLVLLWVPEALALEDREADLVSIKTVLDDPQHFNLHRVRFEGKSSN